MKVADNKRNSMIVGNNSASYNDKHHHNPIQLNPIGRALRNARYRGAAHPKVIQKIKSFSTAPRQEILKALAF